MDLITPKQMISAACLLVGLFTLSLAVYLLIVEISFVRKATAFDATIVEVRKESVHKGKGSVLAYVPIVEAQNVNDGSFRIAVDSFSEEPTYTVGDKMKVLCDLSSVKCVPNTFVDRWGDFAADFILSLVFLSIPVLYRWRSHGIRSGRRR